MISRAEAGPERVWTSETRQDVVRASSRAGLAYVAGSAEWDGLHDSLDALRDKIRMRGVARVSATQLSAEIRALAVAARTATLRPEQFVALVKESWTAFPEVRTAADPLRTSDLLSGIITLCIHEFYRD